MFLCFFFFKQKTAYEMRISDWSSDVCSSDLALHIHPFPADLENAHLMHGRLGFHEPGVRILIVNRAAERNRVAGVIVQAARRIAVFMQVSQRYLPTLGRRIGGAGMILPRLFRAALGQRRIERVVELSAEPALGVRRANLDRKST